MWCACWVVVCHMKSHHPFFEGDVVGLQGVSQQLSNIHQI